MKRVLCASVQESRSFMGKLRIPISSCIGNKEK